MAASTARQCRTRLGSVTYSVSKAYASARFMGIIVAPRVAGGGWRVAGEAGSVAGPAEWSSLSRWLLVSSPATRHPPPSDRFRAPVSVIVEFSFFSSRDEAGARLST